MFKNVFILRKELPKCFCYREVAKGPLSNDTISTIFIRKSVFGASPPKRVKVTIVAEEWQQ